MNVCRSVCGPNCFGHTRSAGDAGTGAGCGVTIESIAIAPAEEWPFAALTHSEVNSAGCSRSERDHHRLAALTHYCKRAVPVLETERFDIRTGCFGDTQPVERKQTDQRHDLVLDRDRRRRAWNRLRAIQSGGVRFASRSPGRRTVSSPATWR